MVMHLLLQNKDILLCEHMSRILHSGFEDLVALECHAQGSQLMVHHVQLLFQQLLVTHQVL